MSLGERRNEAQRQGEREGTEHNAREREKRDTSEPGLVVREKVRLK